MSRPASSPRRWPDLLIGLLVALLLVGFALLLFRPESRPATNTGAAPAEPGGAATTVPAAPGASSPETSPPADAVPPAPGVASTPAPDTAPTGPAPTEPAAAELTEPPTIAAAPEITQAPQTSTPPEAADTAPATSPDAGAQPSAQPATPDDNAATTAAPRSGGAVATSERRTPLRSDYRITLGTFTSGEVARARTAGVSALGYTVYPIDLGSQVVAQVGPFADESSARQALADIQRAYPGALLYPPRNRSLSSGSTPSAAAPSSESSPGPASAAPARAAAATPAPAPSGPTYLQVGAFDRVESAQRLVGQLRDLGYSPTVNAPEGRKVSVLVGPFTGDALTRTEQRLSSSGLDHFRVR